MIKCVDGFQKLARARFNDQSFSAELTGARVTNVLDLAGYPDESTPNDRTIATGTVTCLAAAGQSSTALSYLQTIAKTENGKFLINHAGAPSASNFGGVATFIAQNQSLDDSGLTVSDANSFSAGDIQADSIQLEYGSECCSTLMQSHQLRDQCKLVRMQQVLRSTEQEHFRELSCLMRLKQTIKESISSVSMTNQLFESHKLSSKRHGNNS